MPYVGGSLTSLFNKPQQAVTKTAIRHMATKGAGFWVLATRKETPVDSGELRLSWFQIPTNHKMWGAESGIGTFVKYAPHVEFGTGLYGPKHAKYPITPKRAGGMLRWFDPKSGKMVFARSVMHPGSPGAHMISKGAEMTYAAIESGVLLGPVLMEWEKAIVAGAD